MTDHGSNKPIGIITDQHPHFVVGMLGVLKSGNTFVPLSPDDPDDRIGMIVSDCEMDILITENKYIEKAVNIACKIESVQHIITVDDLEQESSATSNIKILDRSDIERCAPLKHKPPVELDDWVYIVYTSGTTGTPKGVPISHRNLLPLLLWQQDHCRLGPNTRMLQTLSLCFDFGLQEILTTIFFGGTLFFLSKEQLRNPIEYVNFINAQQLTMVYATPSFFEEIVAVGKMLPTVKVLVLGGEKVSKGLMQKTLGVIRDDCIVINGYGPTEASINCLMYKVDRMTFGALHHTSSVPIGTITGNSRVYILDKHLQPVPIGVAGEVYIGGVGVAHGYFKQPRLTARQFIPDPFSDEIGGRLYKTGDRARYLADGNVEFLERIDQQVKIRGYRIELGEIEAILRSYPDVADAIVLARDDRPGSKRLVGYLVPQRGATLNIDDLRMKLKGKLPPYMVPSAFVLLDELPLTANGKLDRRALEQFEEVRPVSDELYVAPRTEIERQITSIWRAALGVELVGIHDNFFDLGGHSLTVAKVHSQLQATFGKQFPISCMFEYPTVHLLADYIGQAQVEVTIQQQSNERADKRKRLIEAQRQRQEATKERL